MYECKNISFKLVWIIQREMLPAIVELSMNLPLQTIIVSEREAKVTCKCTLRKNGAIGSSETTVRCWGSHRDHTEVLLCMHGALAS